LDENKQVVVSGALEKQVSTLNALGIGSDYDVLIDFPKDFSGNKSEVLKNIKDFINSASLHLGLKKNQSELKNNIIPFADVEEYQKQLDPSYTGNAVRQGGSTLDWLAFPLDANESIRMPEGHSNIFDDFLSGHLRYLPPDKNVTLRDPDKQTVRGLRPLLELPFLTIHPDSMQLMLQEMNTLVAKGSAISYGAQLQLEKMVRNARFEGAHGRFVNSISPCMPDGELRQLVHQLSQNNKNGNLPAIPQFVKNEKIATRKLDAKAREADEHLLPVEKFIGQYTHEGVLYHGTPDIKNVLSMIRNGLVISISGNKQGLAAFGTGVYTAKSKDTSDGYAKDTGVVLAFKINDHHNLR
ncbi:MAG: hypothetical protein Q8K36_05315, partial [Alphaproteobacteria bacterium]|nr:hypothetical protein [Alphaproteobacteria bacterium]